MRGPVLDQRRHRPARNAERFVVRQPGQHRRVLMHPFFAVLDLIVEVGQDFEEIAKIAVVFVQQVKRVHVAN